MRKKKRRVSIFLTKVLFERAAGTLEPDLEVERFLKGIPDSY
jgi:hypothetical protein